MMADSSFVHLICLCYSPVLQIKNAPLSVVLLLQDGHHQAYNKHPEHVKKILRGWTTYYMPATGQRDWSAAFCHVVVGRHVVAVCHGVVGVVGRCAVVASCVYVVVAGCLHVLVAGCCHVVVTGCHWVVFSHCVAAVNCHAIVGIGGRRVDVAAYE